MATQQKIRRAVGIIHVRSQAEEALTRLRDAGFDMNHACLITKQQNHPEHIDPDLEDSVVDHVAEGATRGVILGTVSGTLAGLLIGAGTLLGPGGVGLVLTFEAVGTALAATLSGSAVGAAAGSIAGALVGLGIPDHQIETYNEAIERGDFLLIVDGTPEEVARAQNILEFVGVRDYGLFDAPAETLRDRDRVALAERVRDNIAATIVR